MNYQHRIVPYLVGMLGLAALSGCTTVGPDDDDDSTDDSTAACQSDNDCKGDRVCVDAQCVEPQANAGTGGNGSGGSATTSTGGTGTAGTGTAGTGTGGSTSDGTGGTGSGGTGTGGSATGGTGTGGSSMGGAAGAAPDSSCTDSDPITCPTSSSMEVCLEGTPTTASCSTYCNALGFATGPCAAGKGCQCGDVTDQACANGAGAFCVCAESAGSACTDQELLELYVDCHTGSPADVASTVRCFNSYVSGTSVSCSSAVNSCL